MGFDLLVAGGSGNALFPEDLVACLVEARVEQSLDDPTRFAIRFLDDIDDGKLTKAGLLEFRLTKAGLPELQIGKLVTIAVSRGDGDGDGYVCLARGPILEYKQEMTLGGPGSWFEIRGVDRRDELAREYREGAWAGRASDVARLLLAPVYPVADVQATEEMHDMDGNALPQRGSDLDFLKKNARENGYHFWISYERVAQVPPRNLTLLERAHWKASPPLQDAPGPGLPLPLAEDSITIRYNVPQGQCPNVTKFMLSTQGDRPSQVRTGTLNTADGGNDPVTVQDQASPLGGLGTGLAATAPVRFMPPQPEGNAQTGRTINQAALREAGFFVKAEVSTTRYLLTDVLQPHQVVAVEGVGESSGTVAFRVAEVTHVINGLAHFMDAKLETNARMSD